MHQNQNFKTKTISKPNHQNQNHIKTTKTKTISKPKLPKTKTMSKPKLKTKTSKPVLVLVHAYSKCREINRKENKENN
jgi:hypothetical protein